MRSASEIRRNSSSRKGSDGAIFGPAYVASLFVCYAYYLAYNHFLLLLQTGVVVSFVSLVVVGWNNYQMVRFNRTALEWKQATKPNLKEAVAAVLARLRTKWDRSINSTTDAIRGCGDLERKSDREALEPLLFGADANFVLIEGPSAAGKSFLLARMLVRLIWI